MQIMHVLFTFSIKPLNTLSFELFTISTKKKHTFAHVRLVIQVTHITYITARMHAISKFAQLTGWS